MKLNLGCGDKPIDGYINLDGANGDSIYPLPYKDVNEIRASHILEHFGSDESVDVMLNWRDCLRIGGVIRIAVPDFDDLIRRKNMGESLNYEGIIMGGQTDERDYHKSIWNLEKLRLLMSEMGFTDICTWHSEIRDCASLPFSLNLQGVRNA